MVVSLVDSSLEHKWSWWRKWLNCKYPCYPLSDCFNLWPLMLTGHRHNLYLFIYLSLPRAILIYEQFAWFICTYQYFCKLYICNTLNWNKEHLWWHWRARCPEDASWHTHKESERHLKSLPWWRHDMEALPHQWPFMRGIHFWPFYSPYNRMSFGVVFVINSWTIRRVADDLRRHDVYVT